MDSKFCSITEFTARQFLIFPFESDMETTYKQKSRGRQCWGQLCSALLCLCSPFLWMEAGGRTCSPLKGALCWRERQPPRSLIRPRIISVEAPVPPGVQVLEKSFPRSSPSPVPLHFILRVRAGFPVPQAQWWGWMGD